jgi:glucokinase
LLGDIGGTNIRLELVVIGSHSNQPLKTLFKATYLVADYDVFQKAIQTFLDGAGIVPVIAALGIAGPIVDNTVALSNVPKWGKLNGYDLGTSLNIRYFSFLNDFEAASYGVLLVPEDQFVLLNGKPAN